MPFLRVDFLPSNTRQFLVFQHVCKESLKSTRNLCFVIYEFVWEENLVWNTTLHVLSGIWVNNWLNGIKASIWRLAKETWWWKTSNIEVLSSFYTCLRQKVCTMHPFERRYNIMKTVFISLFFGRCARNCLYMLRIVLLNSLCT